MQERDFIRSNGFEPPKRKRGPQPRYRGTELEESREVARTVSRFSNGYQPGQVIRAVEGAALLHGRSTSWVMAHIRVARRRTLGRRDDKDRPCSVVGNPLLDGSPRQDPQALLVRSFAETIKSSDAL
jgi:hypothetical protein